MENEENVIVIGIEQFLGYFQNWMFSTELERFHHQKSLFVTYLNNDKIVSSRMKFFIEFRWRAEWICTL